MMVLWSVDAIKEGDIQPKLKGGGKSEERGNVMDHKRG